MDRRWNAGNLDALWEAYELRRAETAAKMGLIILLMILVSLFLKFGTGKEGGVHLKDCPRDSTCNCYSDDNNSQ
jgi:hypothetical protein